MQLTLTTEQAHTLRDALTDYLPQLRRELARTDLPSRELRHELTMRIEVLERVAAEVDHGAAAIGGR